MLAVRNLKREKCGIAKLIKLTTVKNKYFMVITISHFTVVLALTSNLALDWKRVFVSIQTSLLFICKRKLVSIEQHDLHMKSSEVVSKQGHLQPCFQ